MGWKDFLILGIAICVLGVIALVLPVATTLGISVIVGSLLLVSGVFQLIHAFRRRGDVGMASRFLMSALSVIAGALILRYPLAGAAAITMTIAIFLLLSAVTKWLLASEIRPDRGWGWMTFSSLVSFALGAFLLATFPAASLVVPGIFFGVDLIFYGTGCVAYALIMRKTKKAFQLKSEDFVKPSKVA